MEVIAHRGMPRMTRENTLAGFALAIEAGADGIELDVHGTRDGVVVVHHDPTLPPSPGAPPEVGGMPIASLTLAELRRATRGGIEIPTLDETLAFVDARVTLYVEIKALDIEGRVVSDLALHGARAAVHSFDHRVSRTVSAIARDIPTGILSSSYLLEPERALKGANARDYWQRWELIDAALVQHVHAAGGRVVAWTVNALGAVAHLRSLGVDAVCTDVADQVVPFVRQGGMAEATG
ncbi:MAG TPA: glycerophosphodiester phosphodiesterase [Gemmatimonadaceae bacterium]|nr:glycerophosphodiester phosphodiesterase [Gemmatimonadaceae bacterium]